MKKMIKIGLLIIAVQVIVYLYLSYRAMDASGGIPPAALEELKKGDELYQRRRANPFYGWLTYKNTKYNYEFMHPKFVGLISEADGSFLGSPTDPEADSVLISDKQQSFRFQINKDILEILTTSTRGEKVISTFKKITPKICIQVITPARNLKTNEIREFPTPCDVPAGWEVIEPII